MANEYSRHIEHSEQSEASLDKKAVNKQKTVEEIIINGRDIDTILADIEELTDIQRERYSLKFNGYSLAEIANMKGCSNEAIRKSVRQAEAIIKKYFKKF